MVTHMKTTVYIADALFRAARRRADRDGLTLRALIEEGLRRVLAEDAQSAGFTLRRVTFGGQGADPGIQEGSWEQVRGAIYEGRGG
jgi:hypothetical protein